MGDSVNASEMEEDEELIESKFNEISPPTYEIKFKDTTLESKASEDLPLFQNPT
jgi:hypothetical protein